MMLKTFLKPGTVLLVLMTVLTLTPVNATNSDVAKESRWAEQVIDGLLDGDEYWLIDDTGHEFLSILTEGDKSSGRAVVLVHGIGVHPNWPDVIYPLRAGLLEQGITTLSLQMPILANDADEREYGLLFPEVPGRFEAALDYLHRRGDFSDPVVSPTPHLILLDLRLPKIGGLEVLEEIRRNDRISAVPTVILTTSRAEQDAAKAYKLHANSYLVKPVDFRGFEQLVDDLGFYWMAWNYYPWS